MTNPGSPRHFNHNQQPPKKKLEIDTEIDLPEILILKLALEALEKGLTLSELCIKVLENHLECSHDELEERGDETYCINCGKEIEIF